MKCTPFVCPKCNAQYKLEDMVLVHNYYASSLDDDHSYREDNLFCTSCKMMIRFISDNVRDLPKIKNFERVFKVTIYSYETYERNTEYYKKVNDNSTYRYHCHPDHKISQVNGVKLPTDKNFKCFMNM